MSISSRYHISQRSMGVVLIVGSMFIQPACTEDSDEVKDQRAILAEQGEVPDEGKDSSSEGNRGKLVFHKGGFPQPDPFPNVKSTPDLEYILVQGGVVGREKPILVAGLPRCIDGRTKLTVSNGEQVARVVSTDEGSFAVQIRAQAGDRLTIQEEGGGEPLYLHVPKLNESSGFEPTVPLPIEGTPPIQRYSSKQVTIQGLCRAEPWRVVLGINLTSGNISKAIIKPDQTFQMLLPALSGDEISVFLDEKPLGEDWHLQAP